MPKKKIQRKRVFEKKAPEECYFCVSHKLPDYKEVADLEKFLTPRGKLLSRQLNGLCAKHQRRLSVAVKRARNIALL